MTSYGITHASRIGWGEFEQIAPAVVAALRAVSAAVDESGLEKTLTELIKLRASQINGCAFCVQFHLNAARRAGVAPAKLDLVAAWHEAGVYSDRERAALAWTEALTAMAGAPIADARYAELGAHFSTAEIAFLTTAVGTINAWNRIAGALQFAPPVPAENLR